MATLPAAALLAACTAPAPLLPYYAEPVTATLGDACPAQARAPLAASSEVVPGGLASVRSGGREVLVVAARACVLILDPRTGTSDAWLSSRTTALPTMIDANAAGVIVASSAAGTVDRFEPDRDDPAQSAAGLRLPAGVRLLGGGVMLWAEYGAGHVVRVGPAADSLPRLLIDGLAGPVALVVADAEAGFVTERAAGRVTGFSLKDGRRVTVADGLAQPEGMALAPDGRLLVAEAGRQRLLAIEPASGATEVLADRLPIGAPGPGGPADPGSLTDVAVAADGTIYVSSDVDRTVLRLVRRQATAQ